MKTGYFMEPISRFFRTALGDTVINRIDETGEHITLQTLATPHPLALQIPELSLTPEPTGLTDWQRYNARYRK